MGVYDEYHMIRDIALLEATYIECKNMIDANPSHEMDTEDNIAVVKFLVASFQKLMGYGEDVDPYAVDDYTKLTDLMIYAAAPVVLCYPDRYVDRLENKGTPEER